jgi:hypothetical protein
MTSKKSFVFKMTSTFRKYFRTTRPVHNWLQKTDNRECRLILLFETAKVHIVFNSHAQAKGP